MNENFAATIDAVLDEFGRDIEVTRDIAAGLIDQWEAHVSEIRSFAKCFACFY